MPPPDSSARLTVSVVMAVFNGERYLEEQLRSILAQLDDEDELIIVDDCSTDRSVDTIRRVVGDGRRVTRLRSSVNNGVVRAFERGLCAARGDVVFLSDQDDIWKPGKRTAFVDAFAVDAELTVVLSDSELINENGTVIGHSFMATRGGFRSGVLATFWRNRYHGSAMAVSRALLNVALPMPRHVPMHDMWLGALGAILGKVKYFPMPYLQYRRHGANVTGGRRNSLMRRLTWRIALASALGGRLAKLALRASS